MANTNNIISPEHNVWHEMSQEGSYHTAMVKKLHINGLVPRHVSGLPFKNQNIQIVQLWNLWKKQQLGQKSDLSFLAENLYIRAQDHCNSSVLAKLWGYTIEYIQHESHCIYTQIFWNSLMFDTAYW